VLKLLQSIFGTEEPGNIPESLVREAIERAVEATDPWLRAVSGYRKKLRPAVLCAVKHAVALVESLPPTVVLHPANYADDLRLKALFISSDEMKRVVAGDRVLGRFLDGPEGGAPLITTFLEMDKQEKVTLTENHSGDVVVRDVRQVTVTFDNYRFLDPAGDERETRRLLRRRAYDHMLALALRRLTGVKAEREGLEQRRELLTAKLGLLEREEWGFDRAEPGGKSDMTEVEERIGELEAQLGELGGDDRMLETYLEIVAGVLAHPKEQLWTRNETIFLGCLGVRRNAPAGDTAELRLTEIRNAEGLTMEAMLVSLPVEELRELRQC